MILKALGVAFVLVAGVLAPAPLVGSAGAADPPGVTVGPPCADWAGRDAVALGSPRRMVGSVEQAGIVELHFRQGASWSMSRLSSAMLGKPLQARGRFGSAVTPISVTSGDYCPDLLIGMPGADRSRGAVVVVPDFGAGLEPSAAVWLPTQGVAIRAGDRLGTTAMATAWRHRIAGTPEAPVMGLVVIAGAPGWDASGARNAGALIAWRIPVTDAPTRSVGVEPPRIYHQGSGGLGGRSERGDRLGAVLATGPSEELMVGVPYEDVGARTNAGAVTVLHLDDGVLATSELLWQGHGLPGAARAGDRLGTSLAIGGEMTVIGVPGRDASRRRNSGAVIVGESVWDEQDQATVIRYRVVTQNTPGIPGTSEKGDRFGSALAAGIRDRSDDTMVAVGIPGEDTHGRRNVGAVTVLSHSAGWPLRARGLAAGDHFGSSILVHSFGLGEERGCSDVYVGAPGEDRPGARDAGRYYVRSCERTRATVFANGRITNERFGA